MSLNGSDYDQHPDEHLQTRSEDRVAFTQVGDWVMLSNISATAKTLYVLMAAHVNVKDNARAVWPAQSTLAGWLGLKRAKSVGPYLNELIALGAITKHPQRDAQNRVTRNIYEVRWNPPVGLTTHTSFGEFYAERNRQRRDAANGSVVPSEGIRDDLRERGADDETAGGDVVPSEGIRSPSERPAVVPQSAPEQHQVEQHEEVPLSSSTADAVPDPEPEPPAEPNEDPPRADVEALCARLRDRIGENGFKVPTITEAWRREARLMLDRDQRPLNQACRLIDWCQADGFWKANVLSMPKFRKQYDQLLGRARHEYQQKQDRQRTDPAHSRTGQAVDATRDAIAARIAREQNPPTAPASNGARQEIHR